MSHVETIAAAPYDYDGDIEIVPTHEGNGVRYDIFGYSSSIGWVLKRSALWAREVNDYLLAHGLHQIQKHSGGGIFREKWEYRFAHPDWSLFTRWVYVYLAEQETGTRGVASVRLLEEMTFFYKHPTLEDALDRFSSRTLASQQNQFLFAFYDLLYTVVLEFRGALEKRGLEDVE
jgi:hypothetical protein